MTDLSARPATRGEVGADPAVVERVLQGGVDVHCHPAPSPFPRRFDHLDAARHYSPTFRAVVMKSHHHCTITDLLSIRNHGLRDCTAELVAGIALNSAVGGINPHAVDQALKMGTRVVWMPTISSARHKDHHENEHDSFPISPLNLMPERTIEVLDEGGSVRPEVVQVLTSIAEADAVLASGHLAPHEVQAVFAAARDCGVSRILVNHPNFITELSPVDTADLARSGAAIEHVTGMYDPDSKFYRWPIETLVEWIEEIGPEHTCFGSDLGQAGNPLPLDSYRYVFGRLLDAGIPEADLTYMAGQRAARLLGLE